MMTVSGAQHDTSCCAADPGSPQTLNPQRTALPKTPDLRRIASRCTASVERFLLAVTSLIPQSRGADLCGRHRIPRDRFCVSARCAQVTEIQTLKFRQYQTGFRVTVLVRYEIVGKSSVVSLLREA